MSAPPQTNGVPPPASSSQATTAVGASQNNISQPSQASQATQATTLANSQPSQPHHPSHSTTAPRPRDARTIELLLTAQGVTSYEERVPLLLLDFAYRHTSSVLSDAFHLSADPYTFKAGERPGPGQQAAVPVNLGENPVSANAVQLAIASRLNFQFRGGGATGGGGVSKEWMLDLARERNKVALPRVGANEWGVRLPSERFVLNGLSWGLKDVWAGQEAGEESETEGDEGMGEAMEGVETEDVTGDGVEGGTMGDVFGDEGLDEEMEG